MNKKNIYVILTSLCILESIYIGYNYINYKNKNIDTFKNKTFIENVDLSNLNTEEAVKKIEKELNNKQIIILDNENKEINNFLFKDLNLSFNILDKVLSIKDVINTQSFLDYLLNKNYDLNLTENDLINKSSINQNILDKTNINLNPPLNATSNYNSNTKTFEIKKEVSGTTLNTDLLLTDIIKNLNKTSPIKIKMNENLIKKPTITSTNEDLIEKNDLLNNYLKHSIIYDFGNITKNINKDNICNWVSINENNEIIFDREKIGEFVDNLKKETDTFGISRNFKTTNRGELNFTAVYYGYSIDKDKEIDKIIENIKSDELEVKREPVYIKRGLYRNGNEDIINDYIEIDLSNQTLWLYRNGNLIVSTPVVTGNKSLNHDTPPGIFKINYKQKDTILKGQNYASPVAYWMPFNGGIGLHDATWRSSFGGNIYITNGSHGCVNLPPNVAPIIYNNVETNLPVILYN